MSAFDTVVAGRVHKHRQRRLVTAPTTKTSIPYIPQCPLFAQKNNSSVRQNGDSFFGQGEQQDDEEEEEDEEGEEEEREEEEQQRQLVVDDDDDDDDDDYDDDDDGDISLPRLSTMRRTTGDHLQHSTTKPQQQKQQELQIPPMLLRRRRELHRRHSKRYRENLGELFAELERLLHDIVVPAATATTTTSSLPLPSTTSTARKKKRRKKKIVMAKTLKMKTKSQIITATIQAVKLLKAQVAQLEMKYIVSSANNCASWVHDTVVHATAFEDAVEPFVCLLCRANGWKYGEVWNVIRDAQGHGGLRDFFEKDMGWSFYLRENDIGYCGNDDVKCICLRRSFSIEEDQLGDVSLAVQKYRDFSEHHPVRIGDWSLVSRVCTSLQSEVIQLSNQPSLGEPLREKLALAAQFKLAFAVPILLRGRVEAVLTLYDTEERTNLDAAIALVKDLATAIGNCYGSLKAKHPTYVEAEENEKILQRESLESLFEEAQNLGSRL